MFFDTRLREILSNAIIAFTVVLGVLNPVRSDAQYESSSPSIEELTARAEGVTRDYPWIELPFNGLSLNGFDLEREEFLRGLHAATDLVFEGTNELPESITAYGLFPNVANVLDEVLKDDPFLEHRIDWENRRVTFLHKVDDSLGLSDSELAARYRRAKPDPQLIQGNRGMVYPGALIVDGTPFPSPLLVEVTPDQTTRHYFVQANGFILKKFAYTDPFQVDTDLYQAANTADLKVALLAKADSVWSQVSMLPRASTQEVLDMVDRQMSFLPGVLKTKVEDSTIVLTLRDSTEVTWTLPDIHSKKILNEQEAFREAFALQNQILMTLSRGGVVFVSTVYGVTAFENGFELLPALQRLASNRHLSLREKEFEIRKSWKEQAESILEYFYTSLVDDPHSALTEPSPGQVSEQRLPQQPQFPPGPQQNLPPRAPGFPMDDQGMQIPQQPSLPNQSGIPAATSAWGMAPSMPEGMGMGMNPFVPSQNPPGFPLNTDTSSPIEPSTPERGDNPR